MFRYLPASLALTLALLLSSCGGQGPDASPTTGGSAYAPASEAPAPEAKFAADTASRVPAAAQRRIIYTADLTLIVPDLGVWEQSLRALIKSHGGYLAGSTMGGEPEESRVGTWEIRIPVARFQPFLQEVQQQAEVRQIKTDSEDVSEEFFDLEARLKNKRVEEQRLIAHLQRSTALLQDILAVEKELSRVREEIERMEGRLRFLSNKTELTTITLTATERRGYTPPANPGIGSQIALTFGESLRQLGLLGRGLLLGVVAVTPWIFVLALIATPLFLVLRRR